MLSFKNSFSHSFQIIYSVYVQFFVEKNICLLLMFIFSAAYALKTWSCKVLYKLLQIVLLWTLSFFRATKLKNLKLFIQKSIHLRTYFRHHFYG